MNRRGIIESTRPDQYIAAAVGSDGTATGAIGPCPEGFEWYVERLTCGQSGAAVATTALLEVYVQTTDTAPADESKQGRQDVASGSLVASNVSDENSAIVVQAGYFLVAKWSGLTSGDRVQLSTQIQVRRLVLEKTAARQHPHGLEHAPDRKAGDLGHHVVVDDQVAAI